jgi:PKD repeat protein
MTVTLADTRQPVSEWFEPLTVILDASKTEINVPWDEIVYFTWDFGDGETKTNQQNWVVAHTYNYDYIKENWIFQPKVTVKTLKWNTDVVYGPTLNIKKWLLNVDLSSTSHPSRQAPVWTEVSFSAEFDWLPEKMIWDFGDGSATTTCKWRNCTDVTHTFKEAWLYSIKLSLEFDAVQQIDGTMDFKVY